MVTYIARMLMASPEECAHSLYDGVKSNLIMLIMSKFMTSKIFAKVSKDVEQRRVPLWFVERKVIGAGILKVLLIFEVDKGNENGL